jgi:hypothetical protein
MDEYKQFDALDQPFLFRSIFGGFKKTRQNDGSSGELGNINLEQSGGTVENASESSPPSASEPAVPQAEHPMVAKSTYFAKVNTLFVVFFISMLLSLWAIQKPIFINFAFGSPTPDIDDFDDYRTKWKHVLKFTITFIVLLIVFQFLIAFGLYLMFAVNAFIYYHVIGKDTHYPVWPNAKNYIKTMFWEYVDDDNMQEGLINYYVLMFVAIICMYLFFLIYSYLAKGYFQNMYYQILYNKDKQVDDIQQPVKYIYQYALYILLMMLFVLILLTYERFGNNFLMVTYNLLYILIYIILTVNIVRSQMTKASWRFLVWFGLFLLSYKFYKAPLRAMAKYMT